MNLNLAPTLEKDEMTSTHDIIDEIQIANYKSDSQDEILWLNSISNNPAFDFLKDEDEDIYTPNDGKELNA
ncbi:MAG: hypothetical protein KIT33_11655 [Candidatus Kapabacteria bacterium]|nr:hypothetical protein [Ignavibacteriota bacterium]MCW5885615.1 hypothetical protein [Candidatus Kapabacteria bacterium]